MAKERTLLHRAQEIVDTVERNRLRKHKADRDAHDGMIRITHEDMKFLLTHGLTQALLCEGMSMGVMLELGKWTDDPASKGKSIALPAALVVKSLLAPPRPHFCVGHAPRVPIQGTASDSNEQAVKSVARQCYDYVDESGPISSTAFRTLKFRVPKNKDPGSMPVKGIHKELSKAIWGDQYESLSRPIPHLTESINDAIVLEPAYMPGCTGWEAVLQSLRDGERLVIHKLDGRPKSYTYERMPGHDLYDVNEDREIQLYLRSCDGIDLPDGAQKLRFPNQAVELVCDIESRMTDQHQIYCVLRITDIYLEKAK